MTPGTAGKFLVAGTGCTACENGKYNDVAGQAECTACAAGKYNGATGQVSCQDCNSDNTALQDTTTAAGQCAGAEDGTGCTDKTNHCMCKPGSLPCVKSGANLADAEWSCAPCTPAADAPQRSYNPQQKLYAGADSGRRLQSPSFAQVSSTPASPFQTEELPCMAPALSEVAPEFFGELEMRRQLDEWAPTSDVDCNAPNGEEDGGRCECENAYTGRDCSECKPGFYRKKQWRDGGWATTCLSISCSSNVGMMTTNGWQCSGHGRCGGSPKQCTSCDPEYTGTDCGQCAAGYGREDADIPTNNPDCLPDRYFTLYDECGPCVLPPLDPCTPDPCNGHGTCTPDGNPPYDEDTDTTCTVRALLGRLSALSVP